MINTTGKPVILAQGNLDALIRKSLASTLVELESRYGKAKMPVRWNPSQGFQYLFDDSRIKAKASFDKNFLQLIFVFTTATSQNQGAAEFFRRLSTYLDGLKPPALALPSIKRGLKLLLVELWHQQVILLPTVFSPGPHFEALPNGNELYTFIRSYEPKDKAQQQTARGQEGAARRIFYYMPRILWATSWRVIEDVSIFELADLHQAQLLYQSGQSTTPFIISRCIPWTLFLSEILRIFPNRVSYTNAELRLYSQWFHLTEGHEQPFSSFLAHMSEPKTKSQGPKSKKQIHSNSKIITNLGKSTSHEVAVNYFKNFSSNSRSGLRWLDSEPRYLGREHVQIPGHAEFWREAFRDYIHHRKVVKGYESDKEVVGALNILADYLFLYLPWWKELYPHSQLEIPTAPKHFGRAFIYRSSNEPLDELPLTLIESINLRRQTKGSQYSTIKHIELFFRFVEFHFSEDERIAGAKFRNPIFSDFDLPRINQRGKTSKVAFPKDSYGYLIHYGYAVESFGDYLLNKCLSGFFNQNELSTISKARFLNTETLGFVPIVIFHGKLTHLKEVPNVFIWADRTVKIDGLARQLFIPHLTVLRLLIAATELGLRLMGLRWLDQRTWDKDNPASPDISQFSYFPADKHYYTLNVSTDKTKDGPWTTLMVHRVRGLLLREKKFQDSIDEPNIKEAVFYAGREHSRFGKIVPLFRSATSSGPVCESQYFDNWVLYLTGFQGYYNSFTNSAAQFVKVRPTSNAQGSVAPKELISKGGLRYCVVTTVAINTPHACRVTFATNMQGILETSEIALMLGHSNETTTYYYQVPRPEDILKKLEKSDRAMFEGYQIFDQDNAPYIHPDNQDSSLIRSFMANREVTVKQFGFIPSISLWNTANSANLDEDGLKLLREGPMSLIRFRETHICPVGEECPLDIVQSIGAFRRCGLCPLAMKCIDHLPPIAAKKNALLERIKYLTKQREQHVESGEIAAADALWDEINLETNEYLGWQVSEEVLLKIKHEQINNRDKDADDIAYLVERPDIVRLHLQQVVRTSEQTEFFLRRIAESNAYPSLQTPQIQAVAARIRRSLMAGNSIPGLLTDMPGPDDVKVAAALLKTIMQANRLSIEDLGKILTDSTDTMPQAMLHRQLGALDDE